MGEPRRDEPRERIRPVGVAAYPLVPVAVCFVVGILLHDRLPIRPGVYLTVITCLVVATIVGRRASLRMALATGAFVLLGTVAAQLARYHYPADHVVRYASESPRLARVEGTLVGTPRLVGQPDTGRPRPPKMAGLLRIDRVETWDGWVDVSGNALLQIREPDPRLLDGQRVRLLGWLEQPGRAMNPGQFDYAAFYRGRRVPVSLRTHGPAAIDVLSEAAPSRLAGFRQHVRSALLDGFNSGDRDDALLLRAMLLGQRDPAMDDDRELFRASGTGHFLAVSGLHVGIIAASAFAVARLLGAGTRLTAVWCVVVVGTYTLAAEPSPPVLRAAILAVGLGTGILFGRRTAGVQLLALAGLLLLAVFPLDIYRAGFQLSFVTVLALILLAGPARRWALATVRQPDDAAALATPDGRVVRLADWCDRKLIDAFAAALIAWLASMPLVAMHFGQFHLWSIPASVLAGPLVVASLLGGVVKVVLTLLVPEAAAWWATMASWPVEAMRSTVAWFSRLPLADVPLPTPPLWLVVATYLALVGIWLTLRKWPVRRRPPASLVWGLRASVVLAAGFLFVMPVLGATTPTLLTKPLRVTLLAVGAGQAAVVEQPNGRVTMIDAGSISLAEPWESCIGPFLRSRGIARIDRLVLSHANLDHYNGAADLIERYGIREVVVGPGFEDDARRDGVGRALLAAIAEADVPMRIVQRGDVVPMGSATSFQVHWPPAEVDGLTPNDASIVATLQHEGQRVLFTGDLQADGMTGAMGNDLPDVDVLVAPHHGSTETPTPDFVEACLPEWVVSSDGRRLSQKQRRLPDVIGDRPLLRTGRDGAILIDLSREGVTVESFLDSERRTLTVAE